MARTVLTPESVSRSGLNPTKTLIPALGLEVANAGDIFILLESAHTAEVVVTFVTSQTTDGLAISDRTVTVPIGSVTLQTRLVGPFQKSIYNTTGGLLYIDADVADVCTASAVRFQSL